MPFNGCPMSVVDPMTPIFPLGCFTSHYQTMDTPQPWCKGMAFFVGHFFFEVPTFTAAALELDDELDDEDVLELDLEERESEASESPELLSAFSSSQFEGSDLLR